MAGNSYTISIKETDIHDIAEKHLDITYELGEGDTIVPIKLRGHFVGNDDILRGYHAGYAAILNERLILVFTKAEDLEEVHPETKKYMVSWIEKSQKAFSRPKREFHEEYLEARKKNPELSGDVQLWGFKKPEHQL